MSLAAVLRALVFNLNYILLFDDLTSTIELWSLYHTLGQFAGQFAILADPSLTTFSERRMVNCSIFSRGYGRDRCIVFFETSDATLHRREPCSDRLIACAGSGRGAICLRPKPGWRR